MAHAQRYVPLRNRECDQIAHREQLTNELTRSLGLLGRAEAFMTEPNRADAAGFTLLATIDAIRGTPVADFEVTVRRNSLARPRAGGVEETLIPLGRALEQITQCRDPGRSMAADAMPLINQGLFLLTGDRRWLDEPPHLPHLPHASLAGALPPAAAMAAPTPLHPAGPVGNLPQVPVARSSMFDMRRFRDAGQAMVTAAAAQAQPPTAAPSNKRKRDDSPQGLSLSGAERVSTAPSSQRREPEMIDLRSPAPRPDEAADAVADARHANPQQLRDVLLAHRLTMPVDFRLQIPSAATRGSDDDEIRRLNTRAVCRLRASSKDVGEWQTVMRSLNSQFPNKPVLESSGSIAGALGILPERR